MTATTPPPGPGLTATHNGQRVLIVRRNRRDPNPGMIAVQCRPLDAPGPQVGRLLSELELDDPDRVHAWLQTAALGETAPQA